MKTSTLNKDTQFAVNSQQLRVMETFYSIQGEGHHQGKPAHFIRLGGCDVGCHWCDVKESWDMAAHPSKSVEELVNEIDSQTSDIVIVTGGEPLMHNLENLCIRLNEYNLQRHLETSGAHPLTGQWDWVCLSPKKFQFPKPEIFLKADELKVVVYNKSDLDWAASFVPKLRPDCKLFLQPEWDRKDIVMPLIFDYVKANPQWSISLQIHKYLGVD